MLESNCIRDDASRREAEDALPQVAAAYVPCVVDAAAEGGI